MDISLELMDWNISRAHASDSPWGQKGKKKRNVRVQQTNDIEQKEATTPNSDKWLLCSRLKMETVLCLSRRRHSKPSTYKTTQHTQNLFLSKRTSSLPVSIVNKGKWLIIVKEQEQKEKKLIARWRVIVSGGAKQ